MLPLKIVHRIRPLRNKTCAYCGELLTDGTRTKEHVIARNSVPAGKFEKDWNLILKACCKCNNIKSDLEDDISAISMLPDLGGKHAVQDDALARDAVDKARKSISRRTRKKVVDSYEQSSVRLPFGKFGILDIGFDVPPQVDQQRIFELCRFQIAGFFYFITYNEETKRGYWWTGDFMPLLFTGKGDWGHGINVAFMKAVHGWKTRVVGTTAEGFFKIAIRRHPNAEVWSWALEWNQNFRAIGFLGDHDLAQNIVYEFGYKEEPKIQVAPNEWARVRTEIPLNPARDSMFIALDLESPSDGQS